MRGFRRDIRNARQAAAERANEWLICPKHGGYSPNVSSQRGWVRQDCPGCARDRYEAGAVVSCDAPAEPLARSQAK